MWRTKQPDTTSYTQRCPIMRRREEFLCVRVCRKTIVSKISIELQIRKRFVFSQNNYYSATLSAPFLAGYKMKSVKMQCL